MKLIKRNDDGSVVLELTQVEKSIIHNVGTEFTGGLYRQTNWDEPLFHCTREEAIKVFHDFFDATSLTSQQ